MNGTYTVKGDTENTPVELVKIVTSQRGCEILGQYAVVSWEGGEFEVNLEDLIPA